MASRLICLDSEQVTCRVDRMQRTGAGKDELILTNRWDWLPTGACLRCHIHV